MPINTITAIEAVTKATSLAGVDFIDANFGLFRVEEDETSRFYKVQLEMCLEEILEDLFQRTDDQFLIKPTITQSVVGADGYYRYSLVNQGIYRILKVYGDGLEIFRNLEYSDFMREPNGYILEPFLLITKQKYGKIEIESLSNEIIVSIETDATIPVKRRSELRNDGDVILLDKHLVIYKMALKILQNKSLDFTRFAQLYNDRLIYIISKDTGLQRTQDVRRAIW